MPATTKRPTDVNHKFKTADMPEIRLVRSQLLKAYKLKAKVSRMEIITKAIVPDIDWNKLGLDEALIYQTSDESLDEEFESINNSITNFRKELGDKISSVLSETYIFLLDQGASTPEIFAAASTMAQKYHNREKKTTPRPRTKRQSTSNKNHRRPKPATNAPSQHIDLPPQSNSPPTSPKPSTSTIQGQRLSKPSTKLHKSSPSPMVPLPSTWTPQSQRLHKPSPKLHMSTTVPQMSQPTITSKFPVLKRSSNTNSAPRKLNSMFSHHVPSNFVWNK